MTEGTDISRRSLLATIGLSASGAALFTTGTSMHLADRETFSAMLQAGSFDLKVGYEAAITRDGETDVTAANPDLDQDGLMDRPPYDDPCSVLPDPEDVPNPLFDAEAIQPGDGGRALLDVHVCGNDGYVWMTGALGENRENGIVSTETTDETPDEGELPDLIQARAWYDLDCDGTYAEAEPLIASGTLRSVLVGLGSGVQLEPDPQAADCGELGKLEVEDIADRDGDVFSFQMDGETVLVRLDDFQYKDDPDGTSETATAATDSTETTTSERPTTTSTTDQPTSTTTDQSTTTTTTDQSTTTTPSDTTTDSTAESATTPTTTTETTTDTSTEATTTTSDSAPDSTTTSTATTDTTTTTTTTTATSAESDSQTLTDGGSDPEIIAVDFEVLEPADVGICTVEVKAKDTVTRTFGCSRSGTIESQTKTTGKNAGEGSYAISNLTLSGCRITDPCFVASTDHCIGFEWWLPEGVSDGQTDSATFDVGFYAEQCRHNRGAGR